ncbi:MULTISPECIES: HAD family hydrolase [unclassified Halanaerobium]|uniref:HAD family hydrolase n=1 Tax=unclassified Halanaerobium TaxID=2641197 RepID=UPI000DF37149|nr:MULTISPECIES: HAD hydrolase family protein [unclassified Halanaerobium]RCW41857.1 P-type E1-E2 ATPase [Halanaerobium sp. MA284_MarDTE_T2]RCW84240.1 P-type E1-E2 ATPase [Halanaerobium sp. DL-01]
MLTLEIPKFKDLEVDTIVFDLNGTIACDGHLITGVRAEINKLAEDFKIYVLTADTFGTAENLLADLNAELEVIDSDSGSEYKYNFVKKLGSSRVIAVGNGNNDAKMLKEAEVGIAVIGPEGAAFSALQNADLTAKDIIDVLDIISKPRRLKASLRK